MTDVKDKPGRKTWPWGRELPGRRLSRIREAERQIADRAGKILIFVKKERDALVAREKRLVKSRKDLAQFINDDAAELIAQKTQVEATYRDIEKILEELGDFVRRGRGDD
jgi:chaperonin cofactor prefoldin